MITVDRAEAKAYIEELFDGRSDGPLPRVVTDEDVDTFIEFIEIYAFSERMLDDYLDEVKA